MAEPVYWRNDGLNDRGMLISYQVGATENFPIYSFRIHSEPIAHPIEWATGVKQSGTEADQTHQLLPRQEELSCAFNMP